MRAPRRSFSTGAATASADELQKLAARLLKDRALAERLAASAEAPKLLRSAAAPEGEEQATAEKQSPEPGQTRGDTVMSRLITDAPMPTKEQMKSSVIQNFIPFVGFGFCG